MTREIIIDKDISEIVDSMYNLFHDKYNYHELTRWTIKYMIDKSEKDKINKYKKKEKIPSEIRKKIRKWEWEHEKKKIDEERILKLKKKQYLDDCKYFATVALKLALGKHTREKKENLMLFCENTGWTPDGLIRYYHPYEWSVYVKEKKKKKKKTIEIKNILNYLIFKDLLALAEQKHIVEELGEDINLKRLKKGELIDKIIESGVDYEDEAEIKIYNRTKKKLRSKYPDKPRHEITSMAHKLLEKKHPDIDFSFYS